MTATTALPMPRVRTAGRIHHQGDHAADAGLCPIQSSANAYLLNLGLESLHVRMKRHCENGLAMAQFLQQHPKVA